nr:kinesin-like protein KIN-5D [Tanacetum cinerariifolium]
MSRQVTVKAESNYVKDTAGVECENKDLGEFEKGENGSQQWSSSQESLLSLGKINVASVEEIVSEDDLILGKMMRDEDD